MNVTNRYGVTPLSLACANGSTGLVELLLAAGADADTTLRGGETFSQRVRAAVGDTIGDEAVDEVPGVGEVLAVIDEA